MNKKIAVIASVLKPVNDSRNYEKTAISISKSGKYKVHVVGQKVQNSPMGDTVLFNPLFSFHRLSIKRLFAGWKFLLYLFKIKPDLVIITTFELLLPAIFYKIIKGKKLIYDVQENYFRNLVYTSSFPPILKHIMAIGVRAMEYMTRPFIDHYILAEKNYEKEFSFTKNKSIVLENKLRKSSVVTKFKRDDDLIRFVYTGTIAESYGIFEAVELIKLLYKKNDKIRLKIIGYSSRKEILDKLKREISTCSYISIDGGGEFVSHHEILKQVASSDFGLISYQHNKSTENCIPTKLYEYLAHSLPYLINHNPIWKELTHRYKAGLEIDFSKPDIEKIMTFIQSGNFYQEQPKEEVFWEEELLISLC
jgi:glycosyltransferase involved in cell wall biosynthesis